MSSFTCPRHVRKWPLVGFKGTTALFLGTILIHVGVAYVVASEGSRKSVVEKRLQRSRRILLGVLLGACVPPSADWSCPRAGPSLRWPQRAVSPVTESVTSVGPVEGAGPRASCLTAEHTRAPRSACPMSQAA